jgi:hypothetical protein
MSVDHPRTAMVSARRWLRDWFLLERAQTVVRSRPPERQALVRKYFDAGTRRALIADELGEEGSASAMLIYRDATELLTAAVVAAVEPGASLDEAAAAPWETLDDLVRTGRLPTPPNSLGEARRILSPADRLTFDEMAPDVLREQHETVRSALRWLRDRIEPRSLRELQAARVVHFAGAIILAVVVLALVIRAGAAFFAPSNIALHKKVTISQRHPASVAPADNSGLVNGEIEKNYGIHTTSATSGSAWVMIDLAAVHPIRDVVVHNRADGWFDEGLPLKLELSEDGVHFTELETRTTPFRAEDPWIAAGQGRQARYVRVSTTKYLALTEIEVHEGK